MSLANSVINNTLDKSIFLIKHNCCFITPISLKNTMLQSWCHTVRTDGKILGGSQSLKSRCDHSSELFDRNQNQGVLDFFLLWFSITMYGIFMLLLPPFPNGYLNACYLVFGFAGHPAYVVRRLSWLCTVPCAYLVWQL